LAPVTRIDVQLSNRSQYLHTKMTLRDHVVADLPALLAAAQEVNPATDVQALVRAIWRLGCQAVRRNSDRGVPIRVAELPYATEGASREDDGLTRSVGLRTAYPLTPEPGDATRRPTERSACAQGASECALPDGTTHRINAKVTYNGWSYLCVEALDANLVRSGVAWMRVAD
jgi:hypothetical protein